jgi:hypothetical protein
MYGTLGLIGLLWAVKGLSEENSVGLTISLSILRDKSLTVGCRGLLRV